MSRDLSLLEPTFRNHVDQLLSDCESEGISMTVYFTDRSPYEQAVLWRQSRTTEQIVRAVSTLQDNGASFLANCLEVVGPHQGRKVTNALPGLSWHQWGKAIDCFWNLDGAASWSVRKKIEGKNGFKIYTQAALDLGLTPGGSWPSFKDWVHVQATQETTPAKSLSWSEIDEVMENRWGELEFEA